MDGEHPMSGNNLWSVVVNFLTASPTVKGQPPHHLHPGSSDDNGKDKGKEREVRSPGSTRKSRFSLIPRREVVVDG